MAFFAEWASPHDEWTQDFERIIDASHGQVITFTCQRARLRGTEDWLELRTGYLYTLDDGLIVRGEVYVPPEEALKAAGLSQ